MSAQAGAVAGDDVKAARGRRLLWVFVSSLVVVGLLFTLVNPVGTYLDQRREIAAERGRSAVLDEQTRALQARADQLKTDTEVERLAREQYGLVKPGEEAYGILPSPTTAPPAAPAPAPAAHRAWWQRAWRAVQIWR
jgi:cell division protein FtsB